jgi:hypothetical protein
MNCIRCGHEREESCSPSYYRWVNGTSNGCVDYEFSGLCAACFTADAAKRKRFTPLMPQCPYCGADIALNLDFHIAICSGVDTLMDAYQTEKPKT